MFAESYLVIRGETKLAFPSYIVIGVSMLVRSKLQSFTFALVKAFRPPPLLRSVSMRRYVLVTFPPLKHKKDQTASVSEDSSS